MTVYRAEHDDLEPVGYILDRMIRENITRYPGWRVLNDELLYSAAWLDEDTEAAEDADQ